MAWLRHSTSRSTSIGSKQNWIASTISLSKATTARPLLNRLSSASLRGTNPADVVSIEADVVQDTYDVTGGGRFGPKTDVDIRKALIIA